MPEFWESDPVAATVDGNPPAQDEWWKRDPVAATNFWQSDPVAKPEPGWWSNQWDYLKGLPGEISNRLGQGEFHAAEKMLRGGAYIIDQMAGLPGKQWSDPVNGLADTVGYLREKNYKTDPKYTNDLTANLTQTIGDLATNLGAGKVIGLPAAFGLTSGEAQREEAIAAGREDQAGKAFLLGGTIGATAGGMFPEAPPITIATQRPATEIAKAAAHGAGTVAAMNVESNLAAQGLYDPTRPPLQGVVESALAGGVLGGSMRALPEMVAGGKPNEIRGEVGWEPPQSDQVIESSPAAVEGQPGAVPVETAQARRSFTLPHAPLGQPDIIDLVHENGGVASKSTAGPVAAERSADLWNDQPDLRGVYRQILGGDLMPDQMAEIAHSQGYGDGTVPTFWDEVGKAVASRRSIRMQSLIEARQQSAAGTQDKRFASEVLKSDPQRETINTSNLQIGDVMSVGEHQLKVTEIDPDTLDVTLDDGKRYGVQHVGDGQAVYVDKAELVPREQDSWPASQISETPNDYSKKQQRLSTPTSLWKRPPLGAGREVLTSQLRPGDVVDWNGTQRTVARVAGSVTERRFSPNGTPFPFARMAQAGERPTVRLDAEHYVVFDDGSHVKVSGEQRVKRYGNAAEIRRSQEQASEGGANYVRPADVSSGRVQETPRLRPGENQGDIFAKQTEDLTLAGATGIDYAARQAATERAIAKAEAARKAQEAQQPTLHGTSAVGFPRAATPPTQAPPVPPGVTMTMDGRLPVTLPRTAPGSVSVPEVMDALKRVMVTSGSVGEIRRGRFTNRARGIFKPQSEVVRLEHIDNVPTAVHETGHALMKQFYGTIKASGLKSLPIAVRRELIGLGKALYGATKPTAGYTGEGFSEFIRHYLTTDDAKKVAPNTLKFFEEQVLPQHPEVAQQLKGARSLIDIYRTQGAIERGNRQIVRDPGWTRRTVNALQDFFTFQKHVESGMPLLDLSREAQRRSGQPLSPSADPYKLFKMKRGTSGAIVERMVNDNMVDPWGNPTGPSLKEAFAEVKGERKPFLLYMFARAAEKRWAEGKNPGISPEDATYIRSTLENQRFDRAAAKYQEWQHGLLDYVAQSDPTLAPLVDKLKQNGFYAPLARMLDERAVRKEAALSQSNPFHKMNGSGLPVKDIFDQTMVNAARLVNRAHRSLITNAVVKLANIEGMGRVIEEVPIDRVRKQINVEQIRRDLENLGIDTTNLPEDHLLDYYTPADQPKGTDPIISAKHADGSTHWYYVDPKLYDVLNKLEPFSFRSIPHLGFILDFAIGAPKRIFTLGTTGLRPTFSLITNPLRDPQGWFMQTKAGINPAKMLAAYFNAVREQVVSSVGGKEGPFSNAAYNLGAHMAQPLGRDISHTRRVSNELFHGRILKTVLNPVDHLRQLLGIPESFPRIAEVQRVADEIGWKPGTPISPDQAVQLALAFKEATVDFSASGDVSRIINEAVPFYNPNIQGVRTAARAFRDHPLRTTIAGLAGFTAPAVLLWWKNKDKDWYKNLPWRERYLYNNIDDGTNVWQIPRAFEWSNMFQVPVEAGLDTWYRRDPEALTQALGHIFQTQNPLDYPVALKVAKEQWQNRIDFWDRPIVPKSEVDLAPGAQSGPYTTKLAQILGKAFPNTVSPRRLDAAVKGFAGGAVPDLLDAVGLGSLKATRQSELADAPIIGRLWRRGGYYNSMSQPISDFWDIKEGIDGRVKAYRFELKDPQRQQTAQISTQDLAMEGVFDGNGKTISMLMHVANQMKESQERRNLYKLAAEQARMTVDLWKKQEENLRKQ